MCILFIALIVYIVIEQNRKDSEKIKKALEEIKTLRGLIPICAHCKKIRDKEGYWNQLENYIQGHSEAEFTHSLCPECITELYGDTYAEKIKTKMLKLNQEKQVKS
jgi:hypothetical protein